MAYWVRRKFEVPYEDVQLHIEIEPHLLYKNIFKRVFKYEEQITYLICELHKKKIIAVGCENGILSAEFLSKQNTYFIIFNVKRVDDDAQEAYQIRIFDFYWAEESNIPDEATRQINSDRHYFVDNFFVPHKIKPRNNDVNIATINLNRTKYNIKMSNLVAWDKSWFAHNFSVEHFAKDVLYKLNEHGILSSAENAIPFHFFAKGELGKEKKTFFITASLTEMKNNEEDFFVLLIDNVRKSEIGEAITFAELMKEKIYDNIEVCLERKNQEGQPRRHQRRGLVIVKKRKQ